MNLYEKLQLVHIVFVESFKSDSASFGGQRFNVFMIDMRYMDFKVINQPAWDAIQVEDISNQKNIDLLGIVPGMFTQNVLKSKATEAYVLYFSDTGVFSTTRCESILMRYETNIFSRLNAQFLRVGSLREDVSDLIFIKNRNTILIAELRLRPRLSTGLDAG